MQIIAMQSFNKFNKQQRRLRDNSNSKVKGRLIQSFDAKKGAAAYVLSATIGRESTVFAAETIIALNVGKVYLSANQ